MLARFQPYLRQFRLPHASVLVLLCGGCVPPEAAAPGAEEPPASQASVAQTPEELLEVLRKARTEVEQTAKMYASGGGAFRLKQLRQHVDLGLDAADRLLAHEDVDEQQSREARKAKSELLYCGGQHGWQGFDERLKGHRDQLKKEHPSSEESALVDAMLLERDLIANEDAKFAQVMDELKTHVAQFPNQLTGLALYRRYAERLNRERRTAELKRCCGAGLAAFGRHPQAAPLRQMLASIERDEDARRAREAHVAQLEARLGGGEGHFVIYAHPKEVKFMSPVDYHVSDSLAEAVDYVDHLKDGWVWELKGRFPNTAAGKQAADALCKDLIKKNTILVPGFR